MNEYGVVRCNYCKELIEYTEEDCEVGGDHYGLIEVFITCPECGKAITISCMPSLITLMDESIGIEGEIW